MVRWDGLYGPGAGWRGQMVSTKRADREGGMEGEIFHLNGMELRTKTETSGLTVRVLIKWLPYTMGSASHTLALVLVYL